MGFLLDLVPSGIITLGVNEMFVWYVKETLNSGRGGVFGPFDTLEDACCFLSESLFPWSNENLTNILIYKEEINE
jgi:hypothetical protein